MHIVQYDCVLHVCNLNSAVARQPASDEAVYNRKMWWVYAIYNTKVDKIYIGISQNLKRHVSEHNQKRGNHFSARYKGVWRLVYKECIGVKQDALKREKQLKSYRGRVFIRSQIRLENSAPR